MVKSDLCFYFKFIVFTVIFAIIWGFIVKGYEIFLLNIIFKDISSSVAKLSFAFLGLIGFICYNYLQKCFAIN